MEAAGLQYSGPTEPSEELCRAASEPMCIVPATTEDFGRLDEHQPVCTCRKEYVIRKDGSRLDRHRIDP
jgi:hypothetical protein